jgi:CubicO group peptidase (beta-lactamase class C family)
MKTTGLSKSRLKRLTQTLSSHVEQKVMPGMVALVARDGDTYLESFGTLAFDSPAAMKSDSIFRIASISKVITAVAAMMLIEDCRMRLGDSIEEWIPELANRSVLRTLGSPLEDTVPAKRAITVRDVLTYTMGFGSVMARPGTYPIQDAIRDKRIGCDGPPHPADDPSADEWLKQFATLPLLAQPGETWLYQTSSDVLGILISRVAGKPLGQFLRERIFEPLGMDDTGFFVPPEKLDRFTTSYSLDWKTGQVGVYDDRANSQWRATPQREQAGGGMVSTVDDYHGFSRMLLDGLTGEGEALLSRAFVTLMASDQLTASQREGSEIFFEDFGSWGLGVNVDVARREPYNSLGRFGWTGGLGTTAYIDPAERLITILFTTRSMDSPTPPHFFTDFYTQAYAALR